MGNAMFHKGTLKSYDSDSKIGTIDLPDIALQLHFSVEDLPNPTIPPQIGERVKCFIHEEETDSVDKAKFIVRLDHKNSRIEKPLNRIFYSEEEDQNALKEKQRMKTELGREAEQRQREIEEEVQSRLELELAQAKKEILEKIQELKYAQSNHPSQNSTLVKSKWLQDQGSDLSVTVEHHIESNAQSQAQRSYESEANESSSLPKHHSELKDQSNDSSREQQKKYSEQTQPQIQASISHALPEFVPPQHSSDTQASVNTDRVQQSQNIHFEQHALDLKASQQEQQGQGSLSDVQTNKAVDTALDDLPMKQDHQGDTAKQEPIPIALRLSDAIDQQQVTVLTQPLAKENPSAHAKTTQFLNTQSQTIDSRASFTTHRHDTNHNNKSYTPPLDYDHTGQTLQKVKNKIEYSTHQQFKKKRGSDQQMNPLMIVAIVSVILLALLGYLGYQKYQERKIENEKKARLYMLEQQRLIEEQRQRLGKLPEKKILSDQALDELLGKNRTK